MKKVKELNGREIAGYMKENQAHQVRSLKSRKIQPKLVIIRDSKNPVIEKYVRLKIRYGEDIGVEVEDILTDDVVGAITAANTDKSIHGIIVQLPLENLPVATVAAGSKSSDEVNSEAPKFERIDKILAQIAPEKDVDGLAEKMLLEQGKTPIFESATATAIVWLLAGYDIALEGKKIALVGRGRLVGAPLERMWRQSGLDVAVFRSNSDLSELKNYEIIVSATGVPHLIKTEMVKTGAVIVDAGTASEDGVLVGDMDDAVRERTDLRAITPKIGGVGPLTVTALFEHVLQATERIANDSGR